MSFYKFIQNYSGDDSPLGDIANWIDQDANFPANEKSVDEIVSYFRKQRLENWMIESAKRALQIYSKYY